MGLFKNILIGAEEALVALQDDLLVDGVTVEELKFNHHSKSFYVMTANPNGAPSFFIKRADYDRPISVHCEAYMTGAFGAFDLTDQIPSLLESIADAEGV